MLLPYHNKTNLCSYEISSTFIVFLGVKATFISYLNFLINILRLYLFINRARIIRVPSLLDNTFITKVSLPKLILKVTLKNLYNRIRRLILSLINFSINKGIILRALPLSIKRISALVVTG